MRNARQVGNLVITSDNSGAIGEKELDVVYVPDDVTSYYSTRVTLLEQLANQAIPKEIILLNFTSEEAWGKYITGINRVFEEVQIPVPAISGSTETNMPTLQSGFGITMLGEKQRPLPNLSKLHWFTYGRPLVGEQLLQNVHQIANLQIIVEALKNQHITQVIPLGSKGLQKELEQLELIDVVDVENIPYDPTASAGPSTMVLIGVTTKQVANISKILQHDLHRLK